MYCGSRSLSLSCRRIDLTDPDADGLGNDCDSDSDGDGFAEVGHYRDGITAGRVHTARLNEYNQLVIWGPPNNADSSWGLNPVDNQNMPNLRKIAASEYGICAIYGDGFIKCWGDNDSAVIQKHPVSSGWIDVDIARDHACAVHKRGHAECWANSNVTDSRATLPDVFGQPIINWVDIEVFDNNSCGLRTNGALHCWGVRYSVEQDELSPPEVSQGATKWMRFDVGEKHTCAIDDLGVMQCWGYDGDSRVTGITPNQTWADVATGYGHTCGLATDGNIYCWAIMHKDKPLCLIQIRLELEHSNGLQLLVATTKHAGFTMPTALHPETPVFIVGEKTTKTATTQPNANERRFL